MHSCPRISSALKIVDELITLKVRGYVPIMKRLEDLFTSQRKSRKVAPERLSFKDKIRATNTKKEFSLMIQGKGILRTHLLDT